MKTKAQKVEMQGLSESEESVPKNKIKYMVVQRICRAWFVFLLFFSDFALSKFVKFNAWNTANLGKLQTDGTCKN